MADGLTVELDLTALKKEFAELKHDLRDFTTPARWGFTDWRLLVYKAWMGVKRGGGSFRGQTWPALDKNTRKDEKDAVINADTGALLRSILRMDLNGGKTGEPTVQDGKVLLIGDAMPEYGKWVFAIKGRTPMFFSSGDDKVFANALEKWLTNRIKLAARGSSG